MATPPVDLTRCGCRHGLIFVRPCEFQPVAICSRCAVPVCREHQRFFQNAVYCPQCHGQLAQDTNTHFDSSGSDHSTAWSSGGGSLAEDFAGQGGEFGGGGASGDWSEESEPGVGEMTESPFSAEDYAAFDAVSDYDRSDEKGGGYDS